MITSLIRRSLINGQYNKHLAKPQRNQRKTFQTLKNNFHPSDATTCAAARNDANLIVLF